MVISRCLAYVSKLCQKNASLEKSLERKRNLETSPPAAALKQQCWSQTQGFKHVLTCELKCTIGRLVLKKIQESHKQSQDGVESRD